MKVIGIIPARYRSTRFPGKPLTDILGRPMIWWVYQQCRQVKRLDDIYVATDDDRIEKTCNELGLKVLMTSEVHKTGSDRVGEAAHKVEGDIFINIQGDEPLIEPKEIQELIDIFNDPSVYFGSLRIEITDPKEIEALSTVKIVVDSEDYALYMSRNVIPSNSKDGPTARVFRHVGIYGYRREFLFKFITLEQSELELGEGIEPLRAMENGYRFKVKETAYQSIGVDYPEHVKQVENELIKRGIHSFEDYLKRTTKYTVGGVRFSKKLNASPKFVLKEAA